jgi:hypothetical protein
MTARPARPILVRGAISSFLLKHWIQFRQMETFNHTFKIALHKKKYPESLEENI